MSTQYHPMFFKIYDADNNVLCEGVVHGYSMKRDISPVYTPYDPFKPVEIVAGHTHIEMDGTILHTPAQASKPAAKPAAKPVCECGGAKTGTTHSSWCPVA